METPPDTYQALFWAYLVVWGLLSAYILWLGVKCLRIEAKLKSILPSANSGSSDIDKSSRSESSH
ncbi:MAG: CcmD family protein [Bdellovibrionales bacterium]|nr:CcmD family protein [Bdellovibrionales bacterium]